MTALGYSRPQIARALQLSESTIRAYRQKIKSTPITDSAGAPPPVTDLSKLPAEVQPCVVDTPEGFRAFFERYAPYGAASRYPGMQSHAFRFVQMAFDYTCGCDPEDGHYVTNLAHEHSGNWKEQIVLNIPPRHIKSETFSIWFPIWRFALNRDARIISLSETYMLAGQFTRYICSQLLGNERLIAEFGRFKCDEDEGVWRPGSGEIDVAGRSDGIKERSLRARGAGQQVYGLACDWLIADDVVNRENSEMPAARGELHEWFHQEVLTRVEDEGHAFVIGTRFHRDDLYGALIKKSFVDDEDEAEDEVKLWEHINFPAMTDPTTGTPSLAIEAEALWPAKWTRAKLMRKRASLGTHLFSATYQQDPVAPEDRMFQPVWFIGGDGYKGCLDHERALGSSPWPRGEAVRVISIDPSPEKFAAGVLADVRPGESFECAVLDIERQKLGVDDMHRLITRWTEAYKPIDYLIFEINAFARWFTKSKETLAWASAFGVRVLPHTTGRNKSDPLLGFSSLAADIEFGRIRFPNADAAGVRITQRFMDEATNWVSPRDTDDQLMALWFIKNNAARLRSRTMRDVKRSSGWQTPSWASASWSAAR